MVGLRRLYGGFRERKGTNNGCGVKSEAVETVDSRSGDVVRG